MGLVYPCHAVNAGERIDRGLHGGPLRGSPALSQGDVDDNGRICLSMTTSSLSPLESRRSITLNSMSTLVTLCLAWKA